jgi:hypothetical protein
VDRDSGGTMRIYADGVMLASITQSGLSLRNGDGLLEIGYATGVGYYLDGWIDEVRITKGVARYASNSGFTVPTAAFPRS